MALKRVMFGAAALSAARMFQLGTSFIAVPIMTRLLAPADYGVVAIAMAMVALTIYLGDGGLGRSLMRAGPMDMDVWSSAYWLVTGSTSALAVLVALAAWPLSIFYNEPNLFLATLALAAIPALFGASEIPAQTLFQREKLGWLAGAEVISALAGIGTAIWLAFSGAGVWALVAQNVVMYAVKLAVIQAASNFWPRFVFRLSLLGPHFAFTRDSIGSAVMQFIGRQTDPLVIGKVLGAATLGFYSIAYRIMQMPGVVLCTPLMAALYPRLARIKDDKRAIKELVLAVTMAQAALILPPMTALAVASHSVFTLLLSERWAPTAPLFSALAVAGMAQAVTQLSGTVLQAVGRTGARLRVTVEFAILWALSALVLVHFGAEVVAWGFTAVTLLYLGRLLHTFLKPIDCTMSEYFEALLGPVLVSAGIVATHLMLVSSLHPNAWEEAALACAEALGGIGFFLLAQRRAIQARLQSVRVILQS
ncbi:MAG: oligosaccharide flippase family protein [Hyphomonadaceae bacterium]|nr:oligosaccharide flippase family protein [Hyphomonadaceae bacterium]